MCKIANLDASVAYMFNILNFLLATLDTGMSWWPSFRSVSPNLANLELTNNSTQLIGNNVTITMSQYLQFS